MKKTTCGLAVVFLLVSGYAAQRGVLREGSSVTVRLSERLDSNKNKTDDQFQAILDSDLVSDGRALARAGSTAFGRLVEVQPSGRVSGRARMSLTLTAIQVDARVVPIETRTLTVEADPSNPRLIRTVRGFGYRLALLSELRRECIPFPTRPTHVQQIGRAQGDCAPL